MIEVNLYPGGKKRRAPGAGFKLALPDFSALFAQIKDPWLIGAVLAWVVVGGGAAALFLWESNTLRAQEARLEDVRREKRQWDRVIQKYRQQERVRDSLAFQIGAIRGIDDDRYIWPHVLDQITKALPPYTWLTEVTTAAAPTAPAPLASDTAAPVEEPVIVSIAGRTVDIQAYTTFLRQLANSPWLWDVQPGLTATVVENDRPVLSFGVTVRYRVADSLFIRTVPLVQASR